MTVTLNLRTLMAFATGLGVAIVAALVFQAWRVDAAPGDLDATFVPTTACRLIDTRPGENRVGPHSPFGVEDTKTVAAHGNNGECTIPNEAVGLSMNVTAVGATMDTFLTIWPDGPLPLASSLNPAPGQPPTPNAVVTNLSGGGSFKVYNLAGAVNVIIDVNGYYTNSSLRELSQRVAALEAAGVDQSVLTRLDDVEADTATNTGGIATNAGGVAANAARVAALDAAQPFALSSNPVESELVGTADEVVVSVTVTAPVSGHVIVNSTGMAGSNFEGNRVRCSITTGVVLVPNYTQLWESAGFLTGGFAQLAGSRWFILPGGVTRTYNLVCDNGGDDSVAGLEDVVLTAIFTPAP